jgi:hypothetical protein
MMFSTYSEELDQIRQYAQEEVQRWADQFVGKVVQIRRATGSMLAHDLVEKVEAVGLDIKFSFDNGMRCTLPSGEGYTITIPTPLSNTSI